LCEIEFKAGRREFYANTRGIPFRTNDFAIVRAERGEDMGKVVRIEGVSGGREQQGEILRKATDEDVERLKRNALKEREAFQVCREKIAEHGLKMKLVDVEYQFDENRICFFFTADKRIDFRALVKSLAGLYHTRIELRQIGVRDEARRVGGMGLCGRELCCTTCVTNFEPISSQMVKSQHLSLSPTKISGVCGRLMCCLLYEQGFYEEALGKFPKLGTKITTAQGRCEISRMDIFEEQVYLQYEDGHEEKVPLEGINKLRRLLKASFSESPTDGTPQRGEEAGQAPSAKAGPGQPQDQRKRNPRRRSTDSLRGQ
jgi:cell fate regulator YaaT (PSP1 superfamily)